MIKEYDFVRYDQERLNHLARHLDGSYILGSYFMKDSFPDAKSLVDYAIQHIQDYSGEKLVREIDVGRNIGYDNLINLRNIPKSVYVLRKEPRGIDGYLINIIKGVKKRPTSKIVIIAGPLKEDKHGFYTIFPGINAPPFLVSKEKLKEMGYSKDDLKKQENLNEEYKSFWDNHGFIAD